MGRIKTICCSAGLSLLVAPPVNAGETLDQFFAECAGRYSAQREHAWLVGDPDAEFFDSRLTTFITLLDAAQTQDAARRNLSYRIEAKMAHATLLSLATFSQDNAQAKRAMHLVEQHIDTCQSLLLDG